MPEVLQAEPQVAEMGMSPEVMAEIAQRAAHTAMMGEWIEGRLGSETAEPNQVVDGSAALLGLNERAIAFGVVSALEGGEDEELESLYDRLHQERDPNGMQGPMIPPKMLKENVAKRLGFEDEDGMMASVAGFMHLTRQDEVIRMHQREDAKREEAKTGGTRTSGRSASVSSFRTRAASGGHDSLPFAA